MRHSPNFSHARLRSPAAARASLVRRSTSTRPASWRTTTIGKHASIAMSPSSSCAFATDAPSRRASARTLDRRILFCAFDSFSLTTLAFVSPARRLTVMLTAKDPPYDDAMVSNGRAASRKVEQLIFEKSQDRESYEKKIQQKLESMSEQIVKQRAKRAMEAQGLTMAEAPAKKAEVKKEPARQDGGAEASSGTEYAAGRAYFNGIGPAEQKRLRADVLKKWLKENAKTSQIARDFIGATALEKRQIYEGKLKEHLDAWLFRTLTLQLEKKRRQSGLEINPELQGFVASLTKNDDVDMEDAQAASKRQATEAAKARAAMVEPTSDYWLKVHELHEKYHGPLSRALKSVQSANLKLGSVRQKFVDLLANRILPTIEQTPKNRNPNIPADMSTLLTIEAAIKRALAKYDTTEQIKQEQKRLQSMMPTQRAVASLTEGTNTAVRKEARATIKETCAKLKGYLDINADFTAEIFDSDEDDEVSDTFATDLLKDFWVDKKSLSILPAGAQDTFTLELDADVIALAFKGDKIPEAERVAALAEY